jgi:hypothetical protein
MAKETSAEAAPDSLSSLSPNEQRKQALETFKHAAQEIRFYISQKWQVTNYALVAYGALVAAPALIVDCKDAASAVLCVKVNVGCAVLVFGAAALAYGTLSSLQKSHATELKRLVEARDELLLVKKIHEQSEFKPGAARATHPGRTIWVLWAALAIGALLAIGINISRVPWAPIAACISQSASG